MTIGLEYSTYGVSLTFVPRRQESPLSNINNSVKLVRAAHYRVEHTFIRNNQPIGLDDHTTIVASWREMFLSIFLNSKRNLLEMLLKNLEQWKSSTIKSNSSGYEYRIA